MKLKILNKSRSVAFDTPISYNTRTTISRLRLIVVIMIIFAVMNPVFSQRTDEYYYQKGLVQYRAEMYEYAIYSLMRCLDLNPQRYEAANLLADIYNIKEKKLQAVDYYKKSLAINDNQADIHCAIGELYDIFCERDLAFRHFIRATELDPVHIKAHANLVRYYYRINDSESADRHFRISYEKAKKKVGTIVEDAAYAEQEGDLKKALALYQKAIDAGPSYIEAYLAFYDYYRRRDDYAGAAVILERLKFIKPDYEKAYILLADIYFVKKLSGRRKTNLDKAIGNLKEAFELNPNNYEALYEISNIYKYMKKDIEARQYEEKGKETEARVENKKK